MAQDGQGEARAAVVLVEEVVDAEEVGLDLAQGAVEVQVQACVVQGAVLYLPVLARIAGHAVVERGEGLGPGCRECVQRAVAAAALEEPEQGAARRYDWFEHGNGLKSSWGRNRESEFTGPRNSM